LGLTTIEIPHLNSQNEETDNPDEATSWIRVADPLLIELKLLIRNVKHFGQERYKHGLIMKACQKRSMCS
jgi:hypothetical protein